MATFRVFLTSILILCVGTVFAQKQKSTFGMHASLSLPSGDFGNTLGDRAGGARTGFGIGAAGTVPIGSQGLSWVIDLTFILNSMDLSVLEELFSDPGTEVNIDAGKWANIPLVSGLQYAGRVSPTLEIYVVGLAGLNLVKAPSADITVTAFGETVNSKIDYDTGTSFAYGFGGGVLLNKKFNIGVRYYGLGTPQFSGAITSDIPELEGPIVIEQPISIWLLLIGLNF